MAGLPRPCSATRRMPTTPRRWRNWSGSAYREAQVKEWAAHLIRRLVGARAQMVGISIDLSDQIRSTFKSFGLRAGGGAGGMDETPVPTRRHHSGPIQPPIIILPIATGHSDWPAIRHRTSRIARDKGANALHLSCHAFRCIIRTSFLGRIRSMPELLSASPITAVRVAMLVPEAQGPTVARRLDKRMSQISSPRAVQSALHRKIGRQRTAPAGAVAAWP